MREIVKYRLVISDGYHAIQEDVNDAIIEEGWQPFGNIMRCSPLTMMLCQPMVKYENLQDMEEPF